MPRNQSGEYFFSKFLLLLKSRRLYKQATEHQKQINFNQHMSVHKIKISFPRFIFFLLRNVKSNDIYSTFLINKWRHRLLRRSFSTVSFPNLFLSSITKTKQKDQINNYKLSYTKFFAQDILLKYNNGFLKNKEGLFFLQRSPYKKQRKLFSF